MDDDLWIAEVRDLLGLPDDGVADRVIGATLKALGPMLSESQAELMRAALPPQYTTRLGAPRKQRGTPVALTGAVARARNMPPRIASECVRVVCGTLAARF